MTVEQNDAERGELLNAVGRAAHEAWKGWIVGQGYADHEFDWRTNWHKQGEFVPCGVCGKPAEAHHPDMVPWDDLPVEKRGKYIETGMAGHALAEADQHPLALTVEEAKLVLSSFALISMSHEARQGEPWKFSRKAEALRGRLQAALNALAPKKVDPEA